MKGKKDTKKNFDRENKRVKKDNKKMEKIIMNAFAERDYYSEKEIIDLFRRYTY